MSKDRIHKEKKNKVLISKAKPTIQNRCPAHHILTNIDELKQLAQLKGQHPQHVIIEQQFPEVRHVPNLWRQRP